MLGQSCQLLRKRLDKGCRNIPLSVHLSRHDCLTEGFFERIIDLVDSYHIPHVLLEFEVTESVFLEDISKLGQLLERLLEDGFEVSIDDFGSGFSSLNVLPEIPASIIKLDKVFLQEKGKEKNRVILRKMVETIRLLGFKALCEGIEEQEQADFCKQIKCELAQGYLFSNPVAIDRFEEMLRED